MIYRPRGFIPIFREISAFYEVDWQLGQYGINPGCAPHGGGIGGRFHVIGTSSTPQSVWGCVGIGNVPTLPPSKEGLL
ncbi:hypothetical protein SAMN05421766_103699 [Zobellia uliginosa]|uniref:Uncharacterized protein n=1 Tax=Zobellia uliginosa TaxID=143224 RepID=A0ABY1KT22_9FLAO|nr:hypothetical protein SAMN05421766_103699 [Zobellia uliginosa]